MNLDGECYPCMMAQAFRAAKLSGLRGEELLQALRETAAFLAEVPPFLTPPAAAEVFYGKIKERSGVEDPYREAKKGADLHALSLLPRLRREMKEDPDPLAYALKASVAGNAVDFGALEKPPDLEESLRRVLRRGLDPECVEMLRRDLEGATSVLLVCDNAGEIVLDRLLCEALAHLHPRLAVTAAVRGGPAINDATVTEAREAGLEETCRVITTGLAMAGVDLDRCSSAFRDAFRRADVVLAKGQGNFETLDEADRDVYFLFQVKCDRVAAHLGAEKGSALILPPRKAMLKGTG